MTDHAIPSPGAITEATARRMHAEAAAPGEQITIEAEIVPGPSPVRRLITALLAALIRQSPGPEAETEP